MWWRCGADAFVGMSMNGEAVDRLAHRWMREHGSQSEWHLRAKIAHLRDWGDDDGAQFYEQILDCCESYVPDARAPFRLGAVSSRFLGLFRRHDLSASR
jgi:hypothetical protein